MATLHVPIGMTSSINGVAAYNQVTTRTEAMLSQYYVRQVRCLGASETTFSQPGTPTQRESDSERRER